MYQSAEEFMEMSPIRFNCIEWLPISSKDRVCMIGTLCTAIEKAFKNRGICLDCNLSDVKYDYIIVYHSAITPEDITNYKKHLSDLGRIIILQRNSYGISYLAGSEYSLAYMEEVGGESTLKQIQTLLEDADIDQYSTYYPYPDSTFTTTIFSDNRLPKVGECNHNNRNLIQDRLVLFDEEKAYQSIIKHKVFPEYANEYLFVIGEEIPIQYVKYSNDRAPKFQIKTEIMFEQNKKYVRKKALTTYGEEHLKHMVDAQDTLAEKYGKSSLKFAPCTVHEDRSVSFPFVKGKSLEMLITTLLEEGETVKVLGLFQEFIDHIHTDLTIPVSNLDFIFSNILIDEDVWNVIDYEWVVDEEISIQELAFRAAYCYYLEHPIFPFEEAMELLGLSVNEVELLKIKEQKFQETVTNDSLSFATFREKVGTHAYSIKDIKRAFLLKEPEKRTQIYYDFGDGFSEKNSYFMYETLVEPHKLKVKIEVPKGCKRLRIDPCDDACLVKIEQIVFDNEIVVWGNKIQINGLKCHAKVSKNRKAYVEYIFDTIDPNIEIFMPEHAIGCEHSIEISMQLHVLDVEIASNLKKQMMKIF